MAEVAGGNDDNDDGDDAMCHVLFFVDPSVFDPTPPSFFCILIAGGIMTQHEQHTF